MEPSTEHQEGAEDPEKCRMILGDKGKRKKPLETLSLGLSARPSQRLQRPKPRASAIRTGQWP